MPDLGSSLLGCRHSVDADFGLSVAPKTADRETESCRRKFESRLDWRFGSDFCRSSLFYFDSRVSTSKVPADDEVIILLVAVIRRRKIDLHVFQQRFVDSVN